MSIISYAFLLAFLPLTLLIYWKLLRSDRLRLGFLLIVSYVFYSLAGLEFTALLLALSLITYAAARWKQYTAGIVLNLLALIVFKYLDFGAANLNQLLMSLQLPAALPILRLLLPLGISFYVFKHIGYLVDVRSGRTPATRDIPAFLTFSAFFPQIAAGPISSFSDTGSQLMNLPPTLTRDDLMQGLIRISIGLAKKLLLADQLFALQSTLLADASGGFLPAWAGVFVYALYIYLDFSGYTDIAIGVGQLYGVRLPENFDNPYLATTPAEFWKRWHISLSEWFRVYLFNPLSRVLLSRLDRKYLREAQYLANFVTMTLVGLWHGAGWGFILWGVYHGLLLNVYAGVRRNQRVYRVLTAPAVMFVLVLIGWAFFLSPDLGTLGALLQSLIGLNGIGGISSLYAKVGVYGASLVLMASLLVFSGHAEASKVLSKPIGRWGFAFGMIALLAIIQLDEAIEFLYIRF